MSKKSKALSESLKNLTLDKIKELNKLLEKKTDKKDSMYDIKVKEGKLTKILGKPISDMKIKDVISKLSTWADKSKSKQKSARGMITYIMNITDKDEIKLKKKYESILKKLNAEFDKINEKEEKK